MPLRLVDSLAPSPQAFELAPFDLRRQATRPGVSHLEIDFDAPTVLAEAVRTIAAEEGLPDDVWVGLVIESERAVEVPCPDGSTEDFRGHLDDLASTSGAPVPGGAARLGEFGKALRAAASRPRQSQGSRLPVTERSQLTAKVPYQALTAWRRAAIEHAQPFDTWAVERLEPLPRARFLWEATAAERGETLAEWVLLYAARR
jgi:hypothetical protein